MLASLEYIDQQLLLKINSFHSPFLDNIMWWISDIKFGVPFYLLFVFLSVHYYGWKKGALIVLLAGIAVGVSDLGAKYLFKEFFQRYRPSHHLQLSAQLHFVNDYRGGMYGFVSSHSANMFAIATTLGLYFRKRNASIIYWMFIWAGLIAYSRMYLGVHYPSDVFVGGMFGVLIGFVMYKITNQRVLKWE